VNRAARGLAYSSAPAKMYDLTGGFVGPLFFVGVGWVAGLVRLTGGRLAGWARLVAFRVVFFIVGVLEMPKGPERTPRVRWMYAVAGSSRESNSGSSLASSKFYVPDKKGYLAFRLRFCEYEYITSSIMIYF
jgi:hypothetical protein